MGTDPNEVAAETLDKRIDENLTLRVPLVWPKRLSGLRHCVEGDRGRN
jgi:hypothetical protein